MTSVVKKKFIFAVLFLLISISVFLFLFFSIKKSQIKIEQKFLEWQKEEVKKKEMAELEKMVTSLVEEKKEIDSVFLKKDDVVFFLEYLESLSQEANITIDVADVEIKEEDNVLSLSLNSVGSFGDLYKFIKLIEYSKYHFEFNSFDISRENFSSLDSSPRWKMDLKIKLVTLI